MRLLPITIAFLLMGVPAAQAATTATYTAGSDTVTLTNTGEAAETYAVVLAPVEPGYKVTTTAGTIDLPAPAGSGCASADAGKTLTCPGDLDHLVINGGNGNDAFTVSGSTYFTYQNPGVELNGQAGDDTFTAGPGSQLGSSVHGGEGNDTFNGSNDLADTFYAEPGNDTYHGGTRTVPAGIDPESYQQNRAADQWEAPSTLSIRAARRADSPVNVSLDGVANDVDGLGGTDNVIDMEVIDGTSANDTLAGGSASVRLYGGDGDDTLIGTPQADGLYGSGGNDTLRGGGGADELYDGDYDEVDRLASTPPLPVGNDTLDGGDGDDILVSGAGKDDVAGGGGTDTAYYSRIATQVFDTYPTDDVPVKWSPVTISLDDQANDGVTGSTEGDNFHSDIENVDTTATTFGQVDRSGSLRSTRLNNGYEAAGADTITGTAAANIITTGEGNDSITPGLGADEVNAGDGDDQINAIDKTTDVIACGRGTDNVGADLPGTNAARADALTDCENVSGTPLGLEGGVLPTIPKLTLGGSTKVKVKTFLKRYTISTAVTTDQPAKVTGILTKSGAKIAKVGDVSIGTGKLAAGTGKRTLKVKVAKQYRKALKRKLRTKKQRKKGIKLVLAVTVTNGSGQASTTNRTITVKG